MHAHEPLEPRMSDSNDTTTTVEAAFADAAQAERAVVQLQEHGVAPEQIDIEHGHTAGPGRTAAQRRRRCPTWRTAWARPAGARRQRRSVILRTACAS